LRIYFMQKWLNLSDPPAEYSLYDVESMGRFAGIELQGHDIPDESTILRFRHLLERRKRTERIFAEIRSLLEEKPLLLKSGSIVDATLIARRPRPRTPTGSAIRRCTRPGGAKTGTLGGRRTLVPNGTASSTACTPQRRK
jgi:transposase, IS5 family